MTSTASGRPWQLDDRDWLARRYAQVGDRTIAEELGSSHKAVRLARDRLGIASTTVGQRRGRTLSVIPASGGPSTGSITATGTAGLLLERFGKESRSGGPAPTEDLLVARIRAAHEAKQSGSQLAYEDALLGIASAACLVHRHQQRLRGAA